MSIETTTRVTMDVAEGEKVFELSGEVLEVLDHLLHAEGTDPSECLRAAEMLVQEARKQFDNSAEICECCNLRKYPKYAEHLMYERLRGSAKKLRQCIEEIERKWGAGRCAQTTEPDT